MESILAVAGIIGVAMITPGPNNFIVMGVASSRGFAATAPAIAGIIGGSTLLLVLAWTGVAAIFDIFPALRLVLVLTGAAYLIWLGGTVVWSAARHRSDPEQSASAGLPTTFAAVAAFQFFNPKAWVLVLTAIATLAGRFSDPITLAILVPLYILIPIVCLSLWALGGVALTLWLDSGKTRQWFDIAMGTLLIVCAILLIVNRSG